MSSDFCHWGTRFSYTFRNESKVHTQQHLLHNAVRIGLRFNKLQSHILSAQTSKNSLSWMQGPIFESIKWLDNLGMSIIEEVRAAAYLVRELH